MTKPYSSALVKLLQSRAVYDDESYWPIIRQYERPIREYFADMGVELTFYHSEGYVCLTPPNFSDDEANDAPIRLIKKYKLTYEQSLVAILLREKLEEHEIGISQASHRLFISKSDLRNLIELFYKDQNNLKALVNKLDLLIDKMVDVGYLKINQKDESDPDNTRYEVKTLIKAKISNEKLEEFKAQLENKQS